MWVKSLVFILATFFSLFAANFAEEGSGEKKRNCEFRIVDRNSDGFSHVTKLFNEVIAKWYGPQDEALNKIGQSRDRMCELMIVDGAPAGVIVFKTDLQQESLECKTLCLIDADKNSGKGWGKLLLARLIENARGRSASSICLTVNSENSAKEFFLKAGFNIDSVDGRSKVPGGGTGKEYSLSYILATKSVTAGECGDRREDSSSHARRDDRREDSSSHARRYDRREDSSSHARRDDRREDSSSHARRDDRREDSSSHARRDRQGDARSSTEIDFKCTLKREYVQAIRSGAKTFEGRIATSFFRGYTVGKKVEWYCGASEQDKVLTEIVSRKQFNSFENMLETLGFKNFLPKSPNLQNACGLYHSVPGYTEKVKLHGALALGVRVLDRPVREGVIVPGASMRAKRKIDDEAQSNSEIKHIRR